MIPNLPQNIVLIIPALNEELGIEAVLKGLPPSIFYEIVVCDNGSTDRTAEVAAQLGATVIFEPRRGYGSACLAAMAYLKNNKRTHPIDLVVFLDADNSDNPADIFDILSPFENKEVMMVIGSRVLGKREDDALLFHQQFGNKLATTLIKWLYGVKFTDLGPFRAIRWSALLALNMQDIDFGWTVEMQVKAAKNRWTCLEVPVNYRKRLGKSKISGTIKGSFMAGYKIIWTIFKLL
jgi:glycosyltransferase involved in cell wall biosynthesis